MISEALLHHIWKFRLFNTAQFRGAGGECIELVEPGEHNKDSGPDFFAARICIDGLLMVGNVEIHLKTSDWLKHRHQDDPAYDNLVLHAVFENDIELAQNRTNRVAVLELHPYISQSTLNRYKLISTSTNPIACGTGMTLVPAMLRNAWLSRVAVSRIEEKVDRIAQIFEYTRHDFEETLYVLLARSFGFKINNTPFELLARQLPFRILKKYLDHPLAVEAMLFGVAGFLEESFDEEYPRLLQNEFEFLKHKYQFVPMKKELWKFMRMRPANFPTIRLAQLSALIAGSGSLFHLLESRPPVQAFQRYFHVAVHPYWHSHFRPGLASTPAPRSLGADSVSSIIINAIVPYLFFLSKHYGNENYVEYALDLLSEMTPERNAKVAAYESLGIHVENALQSQALIRLYDHYCLPKRCLECSVAGFLLKNNPD